VRATAITLAANSCSKESELDRLSVANSIEQAL